MVKTKSFGVAIAAALVASLLTLVSFKPADAAATLPSGFEESVVFSGLTLPTNVEFSKDGRVFVAEKSGLIKVYDNLSDPRPTIFADLRTNVHNFWDRGLLGLALDPNFPTNPYVYALYTHDAPIGGTAPRWGTPGATSDACPTPPGATDDGCVVSGRLSRLQADVNTNTMTGPEQVLVEDWCQQYPGHSLGDLAFGPDGALYVSGGEGASWSFADYGQGGGSSGSPTPKNPCGDPPTEVGGTQTPPTAEGGSLRSQDLRTTSDPVGLNGAILRLDPATGAALPNNPLYSRADPNARRIIADGLRTPFRFTIKPGTNEVWVGNVGGARWEEINRIGNPTDAVVENFGWPCYEGTERLRSFDAANLNICENLYRASNAVKAPYFAYDRASHIAAGETCPTGGSSLAGLAFYDGGPYPDRYDGSLFFADYNRGCVWVMFKGTNGLPDPATRRTFVDGAAGPVELEIGPGGDLFYVDIGGGTIRRVEYFEGNRPPRAAATASPTNGPTPLTVNFDGTASNDPDGGAGGGYLSDKTWTSATNGWGPVEKDTSNGEDGPGDGKPITLNGTTYAKGLGVHANSDVRYNLGKSCSRFTAKVGVDDEVGTNGSVVFEVWADGSKLYDSGLMRGDTATKDVDVDVSGRDELRLLVTGAGDGISYDHADWAAAQLLSCGSALSYAWDLDGDEAYDDSTAPKPTYTYSVAGNYDVQLRVTDGGGASDTLDQPLTIRPGNTPPTALMDVAPASWKVGDEITFSGSATDSEDEDPTLPASSLSWSLILHHCSSEGSCHEHPVQEFAGVASGSFVAPDHEYPTYLELRLTAEDSGGLRDTKSVRLDPQTVELNFRTSPTGLELVVGSDGATAPFARTVIVGSKNFVSAPSPQRLAGTTYRFSSWSDGGARSHEIVAGAVASTYTATYKANTAPTITNVVPAPAATVRDRTPTIGATVRDAETDLAKPNISLYLDEKSIGRAAFTYDRATDRLTFTPGSRLALGWHKVRIDAVDAENVTGSNTWRFQIVSG